MADTSWPTGLPSPYADGDPVYKPFDNIVRTSTDTGPAKVRRRFTGNYGTLTFTLVLLPQHRNIFWDWYNTHIKDALPFDWVDLRTGTPKTYRFMKKPEEKWEAGDTGQGWWRLPIELEYIS